MTAQCRVPLPKYKFCQYQQKALEKQKLNFSHSALFHTKTKVSLKYFVSDCRLGKGCKRNLIKFTKEKFRGTFRTQSSIQKITFELHLRCSKGLSKMSSETDSKLYLNKILTYPKSDQIKCTQIYIKVNDARTTLKIQLIEGKNAQCL